MALSWCSLLAIVTALVAVAYAQSPFIGGYVLLSRTSRNGEVVGLAELEALASMASTLPVNRIWLSFFAPTLVYMPQSYTLKYARLNVSKTGDFGFAAIKSAIGQLQVSRLFWRE